MAGFSKKDIIKILNNRMDLLDERISEAKKAKWNGTKMVELINDLPNSLQAAIVTLDVVRAWIEDNVTEQAKTTQSKPSTTDYESDLLRKIRS